MKARTPSSDCFAIRSKAERMAMQAMQATGKNSTNCRPECQLGALSISKSTYTIIRPNNTKEEEDLARDSDNSSRSWSHSYYWWH
mmetsp:Transcript_4156/g.7632  ORF Transcript_4156/g.7632 Transcript_4156/m.7632 type:complete len:85 (+) Transcript_4156:86-340(+)